MDLFDSEIISRDLVCISGAGIGAVTVSNRATSPSLCSLRDLRPQQARNRPQPHIHQRSISNISRHLQISRITSRASGRATETTNSAPLDFLPLPPAGKPRKQCRLRDRYEPSQVRLSNSISAMPQQPMTALRSRVTSTEISMFLVSISFSSCPPAWIYNIE